LAAAGDGGSEHAVLRAAQAGDERAFAALTEPLRGELHRHCYRMLASLPDADDALQETLLRAWRQLDRFEPRAPLRAWLYRIATNVCLTALARRSRLGEVAWAGPGDGRRLGGDEGEVGRLDPYPDDLLANVASPRSGPESVVEEREALELAFVAAIQLLAPRQRAVLLLRDVLEWSAREVAELLGMSVAAVNSLLQRARATLARERQAARIARVHAPAGGEIERRLARRFLEVWVAADVDGLVALLAEDALFTMPPQPERYVGRAAIGTFLATVPFRTGPDRFRLLPTRANHQPGFGAYLLDGADGVYRAHAIVVIAIADREIAGITRFADPSLFPRFGLPSDIALRSADG
jgi:RNA polymerase sigma-70 factor (ECF subfamily)